MVIFNISISIVHIALSIDAHVSFLYDVAAAMCDMFNICMDAVLWKTFQTLVPSRLFLSCCLHAK